MFDTLPAQIGAVLMVLGCGFAFWKGDEPEKLGAGAYAIAWFASLLIQSFGDLTSPLQFGVMAVDVVVLAVFALLSWKAKRPWAVWATSLQALVVMTHVLGMIDLRPTMQAFISAINVVSFGIIACLIVGAFWAWQERKAAGLE